MRTETVEPNDIIIHQSHTYRVIETYTVGGGMLYLAGRHTNTVVSAGSVTLVYRAAEGEVPPNFQPGMLNPEQEAALLAVVAARNGKQGIGKGMDKEKDGVNHDTQK